MNIRKVLAALGASGALTCASLLGTGATALATGNDPHLVTLCHATSSEDHPYVEITVDLASSGTSIGLPKGGHANHGRDGVWYPGAKADKFNWGDIIPPFDFGDPYVYAGLNWNTDGQALFDNGCKAPNEAAEAFITTEVHLGAADDGDAVVVDNANPAFVGNSVHDSALLEFPGLQPDVPATGLPLGSSIQFFFYDNAGHTNNTCSGEPSAASDQLDVSGASSPVSIDPGLVKSGLVAGQYSFKAVFTSGNTELLGSATGDCEPFVVLTQTTSGETTGETTLPATAEFGDTSNPTDHSWILIAALGMILGSLLVLSPARARAKR